MPSKTSKKQTSKFGEAIFEKNARSFGIGGALPPKKDMTHFVKWPRYVRLQRQRRVLKQRLKVPPTINQFNHTLNKNMTENVLNFCKKYAPETRKEKQARLHAAATAKANGAEVANKKPYFVKFGLNHVTTLVEQKKAKLVLIAHDVDPVELVLFMPTLCRKMDVPYAIVKGKAALGQLVHMKTATAVAITDIREEDKASFAKIADGIRSNFNEKYEEVRKHWGGGLLGPKSQAKKDRKDREIARELAKRQQ